MNRRRFLTRTGCAALSLLPFASRMAGNAMSAEVPSETARATVGARGGEPIRAVTLFLCGDVMTGRGIDQILPHPGKPHLFEAYMRSALGYVALAERADRKAGGLCLRVG